MKLIDLLVQELPKLGGWPCGDRLIAQDYDGQLAAYNRKDKSFICYGIPGKITLDTVCDKPRIKGGEAIDHAEFVSVEQYEAALAASHQTAWSGEGLPPVGCDCELVNFFGNDFPDFVGEPGEVVKIIGNGFTNGCPVAFYEADGGRGGMLAYAVAQCFRPIRTEAERKRDEVVAGIQDAFLRASDANDAGQVIWEHIAEGKIPGIKLSN